MSVNVIDTFVLLLPNAEWSNTSDAQLDSEVARLNPNISFARTLDEDLQTLSTHNADQDGTITGFLYVPDLPTSDECYNISKGYLPANVTRQANLPPTDFTLVGIAPWISAECALGYLNAARLDPCRALIFYLPDNSTTQPPPPSSGAWDLNDGGEWKNAYQYPIYAIPGSVGAELMLELSLYSGNMTSVPYGHQISEMPGIDPRDYVRLYTKLLTSNSSTLPSFWVFLVVVLVIAVLMLGTISASMHLIQRARRKSLERRVASGEVNLEALGIKRLTVPEEFIDRLPLFIYNSEEPSAPTSPQHKRNLTDSEQRASQEASSAIPKWTHQTSGGISISMDHPAPQLVVVDDSTSNPDSVLVHKFLPYSQPTCAICLDDFESGITEIRELPCGHIFHPECIDIFLGNNSSLCPLCKKSALPVGYCPTKVTNAIVQRERNLRRLRSTVTINEDDEEVPSSHTRRRIQNLGSIIKRNLSSPTTQPAAIPRTLPLQPQVVFMTNAIPPRVQAPGNTTEDFEAARQQAVEQRIRELAAAQVRIQDPDVIQERERPPWKKTLMKAFPGFS